MFDSFKKKLSGWIKSSTAKVKEVFIEETKGSKKQKKAKEKKQKKEKIKVVKQERKQRKKLSKEELKEEREISKEIVEDIEKEGLEVKSPETRYEEASDFTSENKQDNEWGREKEIEKAEEKEKKPGFFSRIFGKSKFKITEEYFSEIFENLANLLLENNVAFDAVDYLKEEMKKQLIDKEIDKEDLEKEIKDSLKHSIKEMLISPFNLIEKIKSHSGERPFTILFFGINGSGKTTTIAKLAHLLQKNKISCILAAGDTFRAASIEQLQEHGKRIGVEVIKSQYNADPASVAFDAIKHAQSKGIKAVLIDTAGRMYTKQDLMREMEKISRVSKPDLKIFIAESITGNDATEQAKTFNDSIGIDGIILSKADVDEKPGAVLSVSYITKKPILFLGTGQEYKDLEAFDKDKIIETLGL